MKYHYYCIQFGYTMQEPKEAFGDDGIVEASKQLRAKRLPDDVKLIHAYSWPDGSLYQYARTAKPYSYNDFSAILDDKDVFVSGVSHQDAPNRLGLIDTLTLEEKFSLSIEEQRDLSIKRCEEEKKLMEPYWTTRDACPLCASGNPACDSCSKVFNKCKEVIREWRNEVRNAALL